MDCREEESERTKRGPSMFESLYLPSGNMLFALPGMMHTDQTKCKAHREVSCVHYKILWVLNRVAHFFSERTDTSQERPGKNILKQSKQRAPGTAFLSHFFISMSLLNPLECLPFQHFSRETLSPQGYRKSKNDTQWTLRVNKDCACVQNLFYCHNLKHPLHIAQTAPGM